MVNLLHISPNNTRILSISPVYRAGAGGALMVTLTPIGGLCNTHRLQAQWQQRNTKLFSCKFYTSYLTRSAPVEPCATRLVELPLIMCHKMCITL